MKKFSKFAAKMCCLAIAMSACAVPGINNIAPSFVVEASAASTYESVLFNTELAFGNRDEEFSDCIAVFLYDGARIDYATDGCGLRQESVSGPYHLPKRHLEDYRELVVTLDDGKKVYHYLKYNPASGVFEEYYVFYEDANRNETAEMKADLPECVNVQILCNGESPDYDSDRIFEELNWKHDGTNMHFHLYAPGCRILELQWLPSELIQELVDYRAFSEHGTGYNPDEVDDIFYEYWSNFNNYGCSYETGFAYCYGNMGSAVYSVLGNELVLVETQGERSNGPLCDRILVQSNLKENDEISLSDTRIRISGIDYDGEQRCLDGGYAFSTFLPAGLFKFAAVERCINSRDDIWVMTDYINDGVPSNGKYIETQTALQLSGGDYAVKDRTGRVIKRGNVLTENMMYAKYLGYNDYLNKDVCDVKLSVDYFDKDAYVPLSRLGATQKQVRNLINNKTQWLEIEYNPVYADAPALNENMRIYDSLYNKFRPFEDRTYRLILMLDKYGGYTPYYIRNVSGDINNDGRFDVGDYNMLSSYISRPSSVDKSYIASIKVYGDVNKDGRVDSTDLASIKKELKKLKLM